MGLDVLRYIYHSRKGRTYTVTRSVKYRYVCAVILIAVLFLYQEYVSCIGWKIARLVDYSAIDRDGTFLPVSVHHIVMGLISLGILHILHKRWNLDFKLKAKVDKTGIRCTVDYCAAMLLYYIIWYVVIGFLLDAIAEYNYELNAVNVLGTLSFQLLLSGTAEELIFRGLPIICLQTVMGRSSKYANGTILIVSSMLFTIAHMNFSIPFSGQWYSLLYVFVSGMLYGIVYMKSNSIIYPMIMHGVSNFLSVGGCYLYMVLSYT